jgi:rRNA-processing protein FCF1
MKTAIFDTNVYDLLAKDQSTAAIIRSAVESGRLKVIVPRVVAEELQASPFYGVPPLFPIEHLGNTVAHCGLFACGDRLGQGHVFNAHRGTSNKINDALVADVGDWNSDIVVSQDKRLRKRLNTQSIRCVAISYLEFKEFLTAL